MSQKQWGHGYYAGIEQERRDGVVWQEMAADKASYAEEIRLWEFTIRGRIFQQYMNLWRKGSQNETRFFWFMCRWFGFRWR